ncbi:MAG TPA: ABC transporter permease, partial [Candidatus Tumulicola sp.]|nr:ABC transporter permease [Candidatus Tumulicola sp.]
MAWWSRLARTFRPTRVTDDIDEELASHLEEAIARGRDPEEARRALGVPLRHREASRDIRVLPWLDALRADVRFGGRQILKNRVTSAAAILSLGLAMGACVAAFRIVDAVLLRPLPYADPNGLVMLWEHHMSDVGASHNVTGPANFLDWRDEARSFSAMAAFASARVTIVAPGGDPVSEQARYANAALLPMLGVKPVLGRLYGEADDQAGAARVAVLDYGLWQQHFGGRRDIVGRTVQLNGNDVTVVGVLPKGFAFFEPAA